MYCLLEVVSVCPEKLAPRFVDKIDWIKVSIYSWFDIWVGKLVTTRPEFRLTTWFLPQSLMNTNKEDMRELAAQLYALVISTMTGNELQTAVHNLVKITRDNHVGQPLFTCAPLVLSTFMTISLSHRALRLNTGPSWLSATWWEDI